MERKGIDIIIQKVLKFQRNRILKKIAEMLSKSGEYRFFSNEQEIFLWLQENKDIIFSSKDVEQKDALAWYAGYWAEKVNSWLRVGNVINYNGEHNWGIQKVQQMIHQIESAMQNSKLEENIIVVRWVYVKHFHYCFKGNLKAGKIYVDNAFLSTSLLFSYCGTYDGGGDRDLRTDMLLIIKVPSNTIGIYNTIDRSEFEFIIERGQQILIEKVYRYFLKPFIVICRIIPKKKSIDKTN
jgi:hypothetical protein